MPALVKKLPQEGDIRAVEQSMKLSINPSLVMMRECPYSTKTREVLGNPSPPPSRFSSAVGFAPRDPREHSRVEGCKTHGQGKSRGRRGWISRYLPSLGGARTFSHHYQGRIASLLQCRPLVVAFKLKLTRSLL